MTNLNVTEAAGCLECLGNETRLAVFRLLVRAGPAGMPVGQIQSRLDIPASTLSHHIAHLVNIGLIAQQREGRTLHCLPNYARMNAVVDFLTEECCQGQDCGPC